MKCNKKLGILGGMGSLATADFLKEVVIRCPSYTDNEHPVIYTVNACDIPNRYEAYFNGGPSPLPKMTEYIRWFESLNVDYLAVPCNTAHYYLQQIKINIPLVSIVESTVDRLKTDGVKEAWLLGTDVTLDSGIYNGKGVQFINCPFREESEAIIRGIKAGKNMGSKYKELYLSLAKIKDISMVNACTELPIASEQCGLDIKAYSTTAILAEYCVKKLYE